MDQIKQDNFFWGQFVIPPRFIKIAGYHVTFQMVFKILLLLNPVLLFIISGCSNGCKTKLHFLSAKKKHYKIAGKSYVTQDHFYYKQVGTASWYGFESGRITATGDRFNPRIPTCAHRTLPLPCIVEITNLSNNKKTRAIVNDRGPFSKTNDRIIDVSEATAIHLNFREKGHANVLVECLIKESKNLRAEIRSTNKKNKCIDINKYVQVKNIKINNKKHKRKYFVHIKTNSKNTDKVKKTIAKYRYKKSKKGKKMVFIVGPFKNLVHVQEIYNKIKVYLRQYARIVNVKIIYK